MILLGRPDSAQALLRALQGSPLCNLASFTHALVAIAVFREGGHEGTALGGASTFFIVFSLVFSVASMLCAAKPRARLVMLSDRMLPLQLVGGVLGSAAARRVQGRRSAGRGPVGQRMNGNS